MAKDNYMREKFKEWIKPNIIKNRKEVLKINHLALPEILRRAEEMRAEIDEIKAELAGLKQGKTPQMGAPQNADMLEEWIVENMQEPTWAEHVDCMQDVSWPIRDLLVVTYPDQFANPGHMPKYNYYREPEAHADALYWITYDMMIDFVQGSSGPGVLINNIQWNTHRTWPAGWNRND